MRGLRRSASLIFSASARVALAGHGGRQGRLLSIALVVIAALEAAIIVFLDAPSVEGHYGLADSLDDVSSWIFYLFPNSLYDVFPYFPYSRWARTASTVSEFVFCVGPLSYGTGYVLELLRLRRGYFFAGMIYVVISFFVGVLTVIYIIESH